MWSSVSNGLGNFEAFLAAAYQVSQVEAQAFRSPINPTGISRCHAGVENVLLPFSFSTERGGGLQHTCIANGHTV